MANTGTTTYPQAIDNYTNPVANVNYENESGFSHAALHSQVHEAVKAIENALGTYTSGTNVFAKKNNETFGTPLVTGGTLNNAVIGTPAITGGTINAAVGTLSGGTYTSMTALGATLGTPNIYEWDGWQAANQTWTYASGTSFTISSLDATGTYKPGLKIKLTQTTDKYFYVVSSSFSTNTTVNLAAGTNYSLASAAITSPYYSNSASPVGHPIWFQFTPAYSASGNMTFSVASTRVAQFSLTGSVCTLMMAFYGTTGGTASNSITVGSLPITAATISADTQNGGGGARIRESTTIGGFAFVTAGTAVNLRRYDSSNWSLSADRGGEFTINYPMA